MTPRITQEIHFLMGIHEQLKRGRPLKKSQCDALERRGLYTSDSQSTLTIEDIAAHIGVPARVLLSTTQHEYNRKLSRVTDPRDDVLLKPEPPGLPHGRVNPRILKRLIE